MPMKDYTFWVILCVALLLAAAGLRDAWLIRRGERERDTMKHIIGAKPWWGQR